MTKALARTQGCTSQIGEPSGCVLIGFLFVAATMYVNYAAKPEQAAAHAFFPPDSPKVVVERINEVGRYAAVLTRGGFMESSAVSEPILVGHFSFGWQALALLDTQCSLDEHVISEGDRELLMRGMPKLKDDRPCRGLLRDAGPSTDVESVRKEMRGPLVPWVVVLGTHALGEWYGGGGGQSLYAKRDGRWRLISEGGGQMGIHEMQEYGIPEAAWCPFGIPNAKCSRNQ